MTTEVEGEVPVWARGDVFPAAPSGWGWQDVRGRAWPCASAAELEQAFRSHAGRVRLVWTPASDRMVVPEEAGELRGVVGEVLRRGARADLRSGGRWLAGCGIAVAVAAGLAFARGGWQAVLGSGAVGLGLLLVLLFGAIPCYRGWKELRRLDHAAADDPETIAEARFGAWLGCQPVVLTWVLLALMAVVGLFQFMLPSAGWQAAGLLKDAAHAGERWRLLTAPWLHGHPVHWLMNAAALLYLGRRAEVLAGWPHLALAFLTAAWAGGAASLHWAHSPSVGASGGLLGLLGFLLVFESLHRQLVPVSARRRLLAGVVATALLGALGFRFIDNAAHAGGLVAGMLYAGLVFLPSASAGLPRVLRRDRVAGALALAVLAAGAAWACRRML